ncbi:MAG: putative sensory transduction histidine kinase [Firmicutes bacterium]|nr:putative sensory transduction histidine kinase [Bacillota bacterium]
MRKGLFSKLIVTFSVIIAVSFVIVASFLSYWFDSYSFNQRKQDLLKETQFLGPAAVKYIEGDISSEKLEDTIGSIAGYLSADIWLVDSYGYVFAVSREDDKALIGNQLLTTELEELRAGGNIEKKGDYNGYFEMPVHTFEVPVFDGDTFQCVIIMHTSMADIKGPLESVFEIIWLSALLAIILSSVVIYFVSQRVLIKPLQEINYAADRIAKGEVDKRVVIKAKDEIGELAESFNSMADALEEVENKRREFISNVSHEIRSPITSIKGFIGGILDGVVPKEKHNYYLTIAYEEIQRLTRLVNDLLDLSAIESGQFRLRIEEVDINEIIRQTVIRFEPKVMKRKVKVDVLLQGEKLMVAGDKDRLTQVITNLLDNSMKYVPVSGNINIKTVIKGSKAVVTIFNDGPHIPEAEIKNIWDRFYKADKARSSKVSTGLGLSIVRSILTQLGEDVWVENKEPKGVVFTFTLKMV